MSSTRSLSWSTALAGLRADRVQHAPGARHAHNRAKAFAGIATRRAQRAAVARPLVVAGRYDRAAIMSAAIEAAKARREVTGEAWGVCLSAALKGTWAVAKAARRSVAH